MFEVGKKVIAIKDSRNNPLIKKGLIKTVIGIRVGCCVECSLEIDVGLTIDSTKFKLRCPNCKKVENTHILWTNASLWQPLSDMQTELSETTIESILEPEPQTA